MTTTEPTLCLFLDDDLGRVKVFREAHQGRSDLKIQHAETAQEAILSMKERKFQVVALDHDLGETQNSSGIWPGTGMDVVDWMIGMNEDDRPGLVVVHSWNHVRAPEMEARLREHGFKNVVRVPFSKSLRLG